MSTGLTPRQAELLAFIKSFIAEKGYSPSFVEMADAIGNVSRGNIHRYLELLEQRGHVRRQKFSRSIEVIDHTAVMAFFETLPSGTRHVIRTIAVRERCTNETIMREWINERVEHLRTVYPERLSA